MTGLGAVDDDVILAALRHSRAEMRRAGLRTLADRGDVPSSIEEEVLALARPIQPLSVRVELAAAARRWPGPFGRRVAAALIDHPPSTFDATLAAQVWWLVERHVATETDVAMLLKVPRFADLTAWNITGIAIQPKEDSSLPGLLVRRAIARARTMTGRSPREYCPICRTTRCAGCV